MNGLRVGIIGAGGIAGVHIAGWQQLGAQVRIYSRSGAAGLGQRYGITEASSLAGLLDGADVISILTPTSTHHDYALAAIAAGKDVMCEKPLAENAARAAAMANAAAAANVLLFPAHVVRFFPEYLQAKETLQAPAAPAPGRLTLHRSSAAPAAGSWFFDESRGGGIIFDQMIHDLDQARWLAGEVVQLEATQTPPSVAGVVPRPVTARVRLTHANGAVSELRGEWGPPGLPFSTHLRVQDAEGAELFRWPRGRQAGAGRNAAGDYLPAHTPATSPYTRQIADFAQSRVSGARPGVSPLDGVMAVALAEAATASLITGAAVGFSAAAVEALLDLPAVGAGHGHG